MDHSSVLFTFVVWQHQKAEPVFHISDTSHINGNRMLYLRCQFWDRIGAFPVVHNWVWIVAMKKKGVVCHCSHADKTSFWCPEVDGNKCHFPQPQLDDANMNKDAFREGRPYFVAVLANNTLGKSQSKTEVINTTEIGTWL